MQYAAGAALLLSACSTNNESVEETTGTFATEGSITETFATESTTDIKGDEDNKMDKQLQLRIGNEILSVDWEENAGKVAFFAGAKNVRFKRKVIPGDVLELRCELTRRKGAIGSGKAVAMVGEEVAAEATAVVSIVKKRKKGGSCGYGCSDSYAWSAGGRTKK